MSDLTLFEWQEQLTGEILLLSLIGRAVYVYPDEQQRAWLQTLIDGDVFCEAPFAADQYETRMGLEFLQKWAMNGITDEVFSRIQDDYTRLFIGPAKVLAAPWESVYFGDDRLIFQKRTLQVRAWYQRFGLEPERIHQEPDDHIGLEMLFLSHLATLGIQALNEQNSARFEELLDAQRMFMKEHLGAWALAWCSLVEQHAKTDFYNGLSFLTRGAVSALAEMLEIKLVKDLVR